MMHRAGLLSVLAVSTALVQCKTPGTDAVDSSSSVKAEAAASKPPNVDGLPLIKDVDLDANIEAAAKALKNAGLSDTDLETFSARIGRYITFLGLDATEGAGKTTLSRLMNSSTQFILCDDFSDWACLEETPWVTPRNQYRQDTSNDLGKPLTVNEPLKMEYYFTNQFDVDKEQADMSKMLALKLAEKINTQPHQTLAIALYGIDDVKASMKPVYDAILKKAKEGVDVRGVFDTNGVSKKAPDTPLIYSFKKPAGNKPWIFDPVQMPKSVNTNVEMQYNGSVQLMSALNEGLDEDAYRARIEWPSDGIMHNKYMVFDKKSVWTGTSNVTETCMGTERNSNLGLFIDNKAIAEAYQAEFEEMYNYQPEPVFDKVLLNSQGKEGVKLGRFHKNKRPNTRRYFKFQNDVEARVHFAPTDDGEHRVIIPALLAAQPGDVFRIAMFGTGGVELVRAIQYAEAKGAMVWLVLDCTTGTGILRGKAATILDPNPYVKTPKGQILIRRSTWKKLNHHKSASYTRATPNGEVPMMAIIGSQNWSVTGNDTNDENMITVRATKGELELAKAFNDHFDNRLWEAAGANGEMQPNVPYKEQGPCNSEGEDGQAEESSEE